MTPTNLPKLEHNKNLPILMRNGISATATGLALQHSYASWRQQCINARPDPKITALMEQLAFNERFK